MTTTDDDVFKIKRGDLEPPLEIDCTRDGQPVDLTGAETVHVILRPRAFGATSLRRAATGDADGLVTMPWQSGDTAVVGLMDGEVEAAWVTGRPETFPGESYFQVEVV